MPTWDSFKESWARPGVLTSGAPADDDGQVGGPVMSLGATRGEPKGEPQFQERLSPTITTSQSKTVTRGEEVVMRESRVPVT